MHRHAKSLWRKGRRSTAISDKAIFNIAVPIILSSATGTLLNIVDTIMVGQYGADQLAAVAMAGTALGIVGVFAGALGVGLTAAIARALGEHNERKAGQLAWTGLASGLAFGVLVTFLWTFLNTPVLVFLGATGELLAQAELYLGIVKYTLAFGILNGMWNSILNANAYTRPLIAYTLIVNIVHLAGNYLLIYGHLGFPQWGVKGAAVSSVAATVVGFAFAVWVAWWKRRTLQLNFYARLKEQARLIGPIFKLALPTLIEWGVWTVGIFIVNKLIAAYGPKQIAVYHIGMKIQGVFMLAISGFMTASITLVGRSFGEKNAFQIYAWNRRIVTLSLLITSLGTVLCLAFPQTVMRVFMNAQDLAGLTVSVPLVMFLCGIMIPFRTVNIIYSSALRTMGDIAYFAKVQPLGLAISVSFSWLFLNVWGLGVCGVFYAMLIDEITRSALVILRFRSLSFRYFLYFHGDQLQAPGRRGQELRSP